ncbi:MAG: hypothetical protein LBH48_08465, partial [Bifidobacteriaceae bacterium]|nr:hypothetical protein [Bifidobacteriaceae bacterium]
MARYFVLLEAGSKQRYVFATNAQRLQLGASDAIRQMGTAWVRDAVREIRATWVKEEDAVPDKGRHAEKVALVSGFALLLVDSRKTGQMIVERITTRALREGNGLDVWGAVGSDPVGDEDDRYLHARAAFAE